MAKVKDLLQVKGNEIWHVSPNTTVLEALKFMADKDVGALLVLDHDRLAGIISERDFVRSVAETEQCLLHTTVQDYMTKELFTVGPDQSIEECMILMTQKRIRHLPILENNALVGLISIGDVVKQIISSHESTIDSLENYIEGRGYGR